MQVTETLAEGLKHEFQISVPAADLDAKAGARLVDLKDKVRLNGFRPGKVPVSHLKKVYGKSVMAETVEQTIRDTNSQIFTERGFRLATEPKVTMPTEEKAVDDILIEVFESASAEAISDHSVSTGPGQSTVTVTPVPTSSAWSASLSRFT